MEAWWHEVWITLQAEFADITDAQQMTRVTVRLVMAALLGGILGFEREHKRARPPACEPTCSWPWGRRCLYWCHRCPGPRPTP